MTFEKIYAHVLERREEIVSTLKRLAAIPSVRGEAQSGAPFGPACRAALEEIKKILMEHGFSAEVDDAGYLLSDLCQGGKDHRPVCPCRRGAARGGLDTDRSLHPHREGGRAGGPGRVR